MKTTHTLISLVLALGLALTLAPAWTPGSGIAEAGPTHATDREAAITFTLYHHAFPNNYYGHTSTLHLQNSATEEATVMLSFRDSLSGDEYQFYPGTIPAGGTLVMPADSVPGLPEGAQYSLVVQSDNVVESVVRMHRSVSHGDQLASYRGVSSGSDSLHFGPFHKNWPTDSSSVDSAVVLWNSTPSTATVTVDFLSPDGSMASSVSRDLAPEEQWTLDSAAEDELPDGFRGRVQVAANQSVVGWLHQFGASGEVFQVYGPLEEGASEGLVDYSFLPRALKGIDEGTGSRTTNLFVGNTGSAEAAVQLDYYGAHGTLSHASSLVLPANGATVVDLGEEDSLPSEGIWSVILSSDQPVVLGEIYYDESARVSVGTYGSEASDRVNLPHVVSTEDAHTVFSVQNLSSTEAFTYISYFDVTGTLVHIQETTLPAGGWARYDQSQMPQLGNDFEGSAVIDATIPLKVRVDEYAYAPQYTLDVTTVGNGDVDIEPDQESYNQGSVVTLTPAAYPGWSFDAWSGPDAADLSDNGDGSWDLVMDGDKSVSATFTQDDYTVNVNIVGEGAVTKEPEQEVYHYGDVVTLTATADPGWTFDGWSGDVDSPDNPLEMTIQDDTDVVATFTELPPGVYSLTVDTVGNGSVTLDPAGGIYDEGTVVEITAEADAGWEFSGWSGDLSGDTNPESITMDGNKTLTAIFTEQAEIYLPLVLANH